MERKLILELVCLLLTLYATTAESANDSNGKACKTPDQWEGECIELHKCPALLALTKKVNKSANETALLEQSGCGGGSFSVHEVCCRYKVTDLLPDSRHCGQYFQNRIYGGTSTHLNEYPWTVLIRMRTMKENKNYLCGGSLINNRYVLTAGHCMESQKLNIIKAPVRLGEWNRRTDPDCEVTRNGQKYCADPYLDFDIEEFIIHPNYTHVENDVTNDIAIVRLNRYVNFTEFIRPVCLPIYPRLRSKMYIGKQLIAIGFGTTETGYSSDVKRKINLTGMHADVCAKLREKPLLDYQLCADRKGTGICSGDSGGPLVYQQSVDYHDVYVLVGLTSLGSVKCEQVGGYGIFTNIGPFMDWILKNLRP